MSERETCNCGTNNLAHLHDCPTVLIPFLKNENDRLLAQVETLTREKAEIFTRFNVEAMRHGICEEERDAAIAAKEKAEAEREKILEELRMQARRAETHLADLVAYKKECRKAIAERDAAIAAKEKAERERDDAFHIIDGLRHNYDAMLKKLTDPIVREKMMQPGPPIIINADAHTLMAQRDALQARVRELQGEVVSRNRRALDGDRAVAAFDAEFNRAESLQARVRELEDYSDTMARNKLETEVSALQARLAAMTSDEAVEAGCRYGDPLWNEPGFYSDKMKDETRKNIRGVIKAALKAAAEGR